MLTAAEARAKFLDRKEEIRKEMANAEYAISEAINQCICQSIKWQCFGSLESLAQKECSIQFWDIINTLNNEYPSSKFWTVDFVIDEITKLAESKGYKYKKCELEYIKDRRYDLLVF